MQAMSDDCEPINHYTPRIGGKSQKHIVGPMGFEPTTFCSGGRRSIQLSYGPKQQLKA